MAYGHTGLTPREREVMDLWDAGLGYRAIADELGEPCRRRIESIVGRYHIDGDRRRDENSIAAGSAALLAAMKREERILP